MEKIFALLEKRYYVGNDADLRVEVRGITTSLETAQKWGEQESAAFAFCGHLQFDYFYKELPLCGGEEDFAALLVGQNHTLTCGGNPKRLTPVKKGLW